MLSSKYIVAIGMGNLPAAPMESGQMGCIVSTEVFTIGRAKTPSSEKMPARR
jgi:hypothetical protein